MQLDREYTAWVAFNKPMRWLDASGEVAVFPGTSPNFQFVFTDLRAKGVALDAEIQDAIWNTQAGDAPDGYLNY